MTTSKDSKHLAFYEDIYYGMGLDYSGTKFLFQMEVAVLLDTGLRTLVRFRFQKV